MDKHLPDKRSPHLQLHDADTAMLNGLLEETFEYFQKEINPQNGLVADKTAPGSPSSITAVGMGISTYIVGVERGLIMRAEAVQKTLTILRFFFASPQGPEKDAMGYKGFYYHFLDMQTGKRANDCELSTVDTTFFIAGALHAAAYFTGEDAAETEIRQLADSLYRRIDWVWALNGGNTVCLGWTPEAGFIPCNWDNGYSEALLLYILALGSPTFPIGEEGYLAWTSTFEWKEAYNIGYIYAGPLFIHQLSHIWVDFRGIHDAVNRRTGINYYENSRRATCVQQQYAIENPQGFAHYGKNNWGFTASDGPGPAEMEIDGIRRTFFDYIARGAPFGPDDGTVSPWAVVASLPFAPEMVLGTIRHAIENLNLKSHPLKYGFDASFNPTYPEKEVNSFGWVSPWQFGLNEGPIILMIENFQSEHIWTVMKKCPPLINGLRRAGFSDGWLQSH
jgi:hypothetical protein